MTEFFRVRNFERFQHYKDRAPPWIKLYNELLENYEFGSLPDVLKGQLICIWLLASRMDNKLPLDQSWLRQKINATHPIDLVALAQAEFIELCDGDEVGKRENWASRYVNKNVRAKVFDRDQHACVKCGDTGRLELDHILPVHDGGTGDEENLQVLCVSCNRKKRAERLRSKRRTDATHLRSTLNADATQVCSLEREREAETEAEAERSQEGEILSK